ncbi:hypothetical protein, partial [Aneurinibacillus aneurinilyticus]|uniref:hypothetical protein n=1 Tax=Aneurinibacillus aneurinilyticus TaxID=1391 RepID=UPI00197C17C4
VRKRRGNTPTRAPSFFHLMDNQQACYVLFYVLSCIIGQKYPWVEKKRDAYWTRIKESRYIR